MVTLSWSCIWLRRGKTFDRRQSTYDPTKGAVGAHVVQQKGWKLAVKREIITMITSIAAVKVLQQAAGSGGSHASLCHFALGGGRTHVSRHDRTCSREEVMK